MSNDFIGGPGFLAFVVTFSLVVASIVLFRSLSKHLRKARTKEAMEARGEASEASSIDDAAASDDAEGGESGGDQVADEPRDR